MESNGGGGRRYLILFTMMGLAVLATGVLTWYFVGEPDSKGSKDEKDNANPSKGFGAFGDFSGVLGNINLNLSDYYDYGAANSSKVWKNEGQGLELEVVNALDDTWQTEFDLAVSDWDNGSPDSMTLTVTRGEVDYSCKEQEGVLKVCSGNFGDTGWLGINEMIYIQSTGEVLSSVAKMNEYFLRNADSAIRQYTMCHQLGHGYGLSHTDEVFTNPSPGNCMDYTNKPEENMHPDSSNYNRLASIYGTVGGRRRYLGKQLRRGQNRAPVLTEDLREEYADAVAEIEQLSVRRALSESGESGNTQWELIHARPSGSTYERPLGTKYHIQAHVLHQFDILN